MESPNQDPRMSLTENELLWEEPDAKQSREETDLVEFQGLLAEGDKPMTEIVPLAGDDQGRTPKPNRVLTREMQRIQAAEREQLETVRRKTGEAAEGKNTTHEAEDCSGKAENPASATEDVGGPSPEGGGTTRKGPCAWSGSPNQGTSAKAAASPTSSSLRRPGRT